jgi:superoxide reductase
MTKLREIYKCNICGNIVEVVHTGVGALVCCGQNMELLKEKTKDAATEKHVPYIEKTEKGILVKIGQNQDHPMEKEHYIEWIEVIAQGNTFRKFLQPDDKPQAEFPGQSENVEAREYCNVHGLWKS